MRKLIRFIPLAVVILALFLFPTGAFAQGTHKVTLTWTASVDGGAVTVYRASGACSVSSVFTSISTGVAVNTYVDTALAVGNYCYQVTTVVNGAESLPSNQVTARILPSSPTSLALVVQ